MRTVAKTCLTLALIAVLASPALAQRRRPGGGQPGRGGPGFGGPGFLLANKSVQEELKITDDQKKKIEEVNKKVDDAIQEKTKDIEDRRERFQKGFEIRREMADQTTKELMGVLKDEQKKRLEQIQNQMAGVRAFANEEVQKKLNLTDEQKTALKEVGEEYRTQAEKAREEAGRDFQKMREATQKLNKETMGKIAAKLTSEQKKAWKELTGEPFEIKFEGFPGGGRDRRPGGRDRRQTDQ
jgi:Spy/CpxP family protein refolding chaperone